MNQTQLIMPLLSPTVASAERMRKPILRSRACHTRTRTVGLLPELELGDGDGVAVVDVAAREEEQEVLHGVDAELLELLEEGDADALEGVEFGVRAEGRVVPPACRGGAVAGLGASGARDVGCWMLDVGDRGLGHGAWVCGGVGGASSCGRSRLRPYAGTVCLEGRQRLFEPGFSADGSHAAVAAVREGCDARRSSGAEVVRSHCG